MNDIVKKLYDNEITERGLAALEEKYPSTLVVDMTDDDEFKKARKVRTERNKLVEAINRRRIDTSNDIKATGDALIERVEGIYAVLVDPFETEDKRRKEVAKQEAEAKQKIIDDGRAQIAKFRGFISEARMGDSQVVSSLIDALTNIDCTTFHKDLVHEAAEEKESVLAELTGMLTSKLELEESERKNKELEARLAAMEAAQEKEAEPEPEPEPASIEPTSDSRERTITIKVNCTDDAARDIHGQIVSLLDSVAPGSDVVLEA